VGRLAHSASLLGIGDGPDYGDRDRCGDLVLQYEDFHEITVIAFGPDVLAGFGLDKLRRDADPTAGLAQSAFEDIAHPQFAPDLFHIHGTTLVGEAGIARDNE